MSTRCKTRKKVKKQNKFKNQNCDLLINKVNKYKEENTNLIFCQKMLCPQEWSNVIEIKELGKFFFCFEHADDFEEKELPKILDNLPDEKLEKIIKANQE
ncbi:hypothetical protein [Spiroplasma endosymbiont of Colias croceus]|uniref:hypothetical protein n=2 Tax=unclassified Spiroplasma TaxID=2637901 RepID=UPI0030D03CB0